MMLHTFGITSAEVSRNDRFDVALFKERVIDVAAVGDKINPKALGRLAMTLGAKGSLDDVVKAIMFTFNSSNSRLKRRRAEGGYVYEKIAEEK